jgi:hypothetical protein
MTQDQNVLGLTPSSEETICPAPFVFQKYEAKSDTE